jgi:hypothetical protein
MACAVDETVSYWPFTAEAHLQYQTLFVGFFMDKVAMGLFFPAGPSVSSCQYHSTGAPCSLIHLQPTLYNLNN